MNKAELIAAMSEKAELSKKDAEKAIKAFTDAVAEELVLTLGGMGWNKVSPHRTQNNLKRVKHLLLGFLFSIFRLGNRNCGRQYLELGR